MPLLANSIDTITRKLSMVIWIVDDYTKKQPLGVVNVSVIEKASVKKLKLVRNLSGHYIFTDLAKGQYELYINSDFYAPEERTYDTASIRDSEVSLEFKGVGPAKGSTDTKLKDVSELRVNDNIKFHNPIGNIEERKIIDIKNTNNTIEWKKELKNDFSIGGSAISLLNYIIDDIFLQPKTSYPFPGNTTLLMGNVFSGNEPVVDAVVKIKEMGIDNKTNESGEFVLSFKGFKGDKIELYEGQIIIEIGEEEKPLNTEKVIIQRGNINSFSGAIILP